MSKTPAETATQATPEIDNTSFLKATKETKRKYGRFNLAIVGGTGVGKSTLVNAVFGEERAKTGRGMRSTPRA